MVADGMIWDGVALLISSYLGFVGGSGMRASFYLGRRMGGIVVGAVFIVAGMMLAFLSNIVVHILEFALAGDVWVLVGAVTGFLAAEPEDAGVLTEEDDVAVGTIAPIAAEMVLGRLTPEQAEKEVQDSAILEPKALSLWRSMNAKERKELGLDFIRIAADPEVAARIEKHLKPMQELDPDLWERSLTQARERYGRPHSDKRP